jgi:hypothetical protein
MMKIVAKGIAQLCDGITREATGGMNDVSFRLQC